jgi:hypothetical protein
MAIFFFTQNPITTLSTDSYAKKVGLSPDVIDFTEAAENHTYRSARKRVL